MDTCLEEPKTLLKDILDILSVEIHSTLVLKENLPKVYFKFEEDFSALIFQLFKYYRLTSNIFENAILLKRNTLFFKNDLMYDLRTIDNLETKFKVLFHNDNSYELFKTLVMFLWEEQYNNLLNIVDKSFNNGDRKVFIADGKDKLLSVYLSVVTLLYGILKLNDKKLLFYYQPFYYKVEGFFSFFVDKSIELLTPDTKIILDYKYCDREYTIFDKELYVDNQQTVDIIKLLNHFNEIYILNIENANIDLNNFSEELRKKIKLDDDTEDLLD